MRLAVMVQLVGLVQLVEMVRLVGMVLLVGLVGMVLLVGLVGWLLQLVEQLNSEEVHTMEDTPKNSIK